MYAAEQRGVVVRCTLINDGMVDCSRVACVQLKGLREVMWALYLHDSGRIFYRGVGGTKEIPGCFQRGEFQFAL